MSVISGNSPNPQTRSIEVELPSWEQVIRLCDRRCQGAVRIRVRAAELIEGEHVQIALRLPSGFVARVRSRVIASPPQPRGGTAQLSIELSGLSVHMIDRLRALAAPHTNVAPPQALVERAARVAAGTPRPEAITGWESANWEQLTAAVCSRMKVSDLLRNNRQLREQIDGVPKRAPTLKR